MIPGRRSRATEPTKEIKHGGDTHQHYPDLVHDNHQVEAPRTPEQGYHLTEDLVDKAIQFVGDSKQVCIAALVEAGEYPGFVRRG